MHASVMEFVARVAIPAGTVCELGSYNINGSARKFWPNSRYVGIDIRPGPGVDVVADVGIGCLDVLEGLFDVVVSTETLEHVRNWKAFLRRCQLFVKPGGTLILTARGPGFPRHAYPNDYWRFPTEMMRRCLWDGEVIDDPGASGFLACCRKPDDWTPTPFSEWPDADPAPH